MPQILKASIYFNRPQPLEYLISSNESFRQFILVSSKCNYYNRLINLIENQHFNIANFIIEKLNLKFSDIAQETRMYFIRQKNLSAIEFIYTKMPKVNKECDLDLRYAIAHEKWEIADLLLKYNANIFYDDDYNLRYCCFYQRLSSLHYVIKNGYDLSSSNMYKILDYCIHNKVYQSAIFLINNGLSASHLLIKLIHEKNYEFLKTLLNTGLNASYDENLLLRYAKKNEDSSLITILKSHGINTNLLTEINNEREIFEEIIDLQNNSKIISESFIPYVANFNLENFRPVIANHTINIVLKTIQKKIQISHFDMAKVFKADNLKLYHFLADIFAKDNAWGTRGELSLACGLGSPKIIKHLFSKNYYRTNRHSFLIAMTQEQLHSVKFLIRNGMKLNFIKPIILNRLFSGIISLKIFKHIQKRLNLDLSDLQMLFDKSIECENFKLSVYILNHLPQDSYYYSIWISKLLCGLLNDDKQHQNIIFVLKKILSQDKFTYLTLMNDLMRAALFNFSPKNIKFIMRFLFKNKVYGDREVLLNELLLECPHFKKFEVIEFLLLCGADYNYKDKLFLRDICYYENIGLLDHLISQGLDLNKEGEFLLNYCCLYGNFIMAEYLLILGVKGIGTVCWLYNSHKFDKAQFLLEHGINKEDALIKAAHADYFVACKHLVMEGADIHTENERPLQLAVQQGNFSIIKLLVDHDAAINKYVLLAACTATDDRVDIIEYLIKNIPDKTSFNNDLIPLSQKVGNFKIYHFLKEVIEQRFLQ
jgi:hypothetical protein